MKKLISPDVDLAKRFEHLCASGDIGQIKKMFSQSLIPSIDGISNLGIPLLRAVQGGHLDVVKFLLTDASIPFHADIARDKFEVLNCVFDTASGFSILNFLTTPNILLRPDYTPTVSPKKTGKAIEHMLYRLLISAIQQNNSQAVNYLLCSPELSHHANPNTNFYETYLALFIMPLDSSFKNPEDFVPLLFSPNIVHPLDITKNLEEIKNFALELLMVKEGGLIITSLAQRQEWEAVASIENYIMARKVPQQINRIKELLDPFKIKKELESALLTPKNSAVHKL